MAFRSAAKQSFLDANGVKHLWEKIKKLLDSKLDSVEPKDHSIVVSESNHVGVKISDTEENILQLNDEHGEEGLYVPAPPKPHKLIFGANEEYSYDGSEDITIPVYTGEIHH